MPFQIMPLHISHFISQNLGMRIVCLYWWSATSYCVRLELTNKVSAMWKIQNIANISAKRGCFLTEDKWFCYQLSLYCHMQSQCCFTRTVQGSIQSLSLHYCKHMEMCTSTLRVQWDSSVPYVSLYTMFAGLEFTITKTVTRRTKKDKLK